MNTLDRIRIVMVNTSDPGNIGAAARAVKTMGFSQLCLVAPKEYPSAKATARASGASDVLHKAKVVDTLEEAVADCNMVVATSTRLRTIPWPVMNPREFAGFVEKEHDDSQIAIVFGREDSGLSNEELRKCHYHVSVPGNPEYSVLNIAAAIQVICYELRMSLVEMPLEIEVDESRQMAVSYTEWDTPVCSAEDMERFFLHLEQTLLDIRFFDPNNPRQILTRSRRLFSRTRLDRLEMNLMRGILAKVQEVAAKAQLSEPKSKPGDAEMDSTKK